MAGWSTHKGMAVRLPMDNVDTDQLIPARFMSTPRSEGYGDYLLHDLRRNEDGALLDQLEINSADGASIMISGHNFGSGSSREAAVYALVDAGFKAILAPSFGDIFASNAVNNGLLPARVPAEKLASLSTDAPIQIDLERLVISNATEEITLELDPVWQTKLIKGWDDIDMTRAHASQITAYRADRRAMMPWTWPNTQNTSEESNGGDFQ